MGEGGGGEEKGRFLSFSSLPFSLPSFPFSPETPDTQAIAIVTIVAITGKHVNHHYRSITRPAKATDVGIKRRIFDDSTGNGDFEFSVDPINLF